MERTNGSSAPRETLALVYDFTPLATVDEVLERAGGDFDVLFVCDTGKPWGVDAHRELTEKGHHPITLEEAQENPSLLAHCAGITSLSDFSMGPTSALAQAAGFDTFHSVDEITTITSKARQRAVYARHGVPQPPWVELDLDDPRCWDTVPASLESLPLIIKPVIGAGSRDVSRASSVAEARELLADHEGRWVLEGEILGIEHPAGSWLAPFVSAEIVSFDGQHTLMGIVDHTPFAPPFRMTGDLMPTALPDDLEQKCGDAGIAAVDALGIRYGYSHVEMIIGAEGPMIVEVNGRFTTTVEDACQHLFGTSPLRHVMDVARGAEPGVQPYRKDRGYFMRLSVPAPTTPIDREDALAVLPRVQEHEAVQGHAIYNLDALDGNAPMNALSTVMVISLSAPTLAEMEAAFSDVKALLSSVGFFEYERTSAVS